MTGAHPIIIIMVVLGQNLFFTVGVLQIVGYEDNVGGVRGGEA